MSRKASRSVRGAGRGVLVFFWRCGLLGNISRGFSVSIQRLLCNGDVIGFEDDLSKRATHVFGVFFPRQNSILVDDQDGWDSRSSGSRHVLRLHLAIDVFADSGSHQFCVGLFDLFGFGCST